MNNELHNDSIVISTSTRLKTRKTEHLAHIPADFAAVGTVLFGRCICIHSLVPFSDDDRHCGKSCCDIVAKQRSRNL